MFSTLIENCGASTIRLMTQLRAEHADGKNPNLGVDGNKGVITNMDEIKVWEPYLVKSQTYKTAIEVLHTPLHFTSALRAGGSA